VARIRSNIKNIATIFHEVIKRPTLRFVADGRRARSGCVVVQNLDSDLIAVTGGCAQAGRLLQSILRVRVVEHKAPGGENLPDVFGRYQVLQNEIRFIPHFPFEPGMQYLASFDPGLLGCPALSDLVTLEFSLPGKMGALSTQVTQVFPSGDQLPENLLRFYICFSNSMQRGQTEEQVRLLGPDGKPAPDVLYRPPVELWDRSMRHLTILLDPGRLKRGVGPNRELGPPLKAGHQYTLTIGSGMLDSSDCPLGESVYKRFHVTDAIREPIAVEQWRILPPATNSRESLALMFPKPLDWALLLGTIDVVSERGQSIDGCIAIDQGERRWSFSPASPWTTGPYSVRIATGLEDVCGNTLLEAFDRPLRSGSSLISEAATRSIPFICTFDK
jgi:hypothetical protein